MLLISHRGNLSGPNLELENSEAHIIKALENGFDVEIDVWLHNEEVSLGHDEPKHRIDIEFLSARKEHLWIHCKNLAMLNLMLSLNGFRFFWHQTDDYTLTSNGYIWTYFNRPVSDKNIIMIKERINRDELPECFGVCSDYVVFYK